MTPWMDGESFLRMSLALFLVSWEQLFLYLLMTILGAIDLGVGGDICAQRQCELCAFLV